MLPLNRRKFITQASTAVGATVLLSAPLVGSALDLFRPDGPVTVGQVMDAFIHEIPGAPFASTVDTLKAGNRNIEITGMVTTMFATIAVIRKAIELGANFIVAHEPTFYNHTDATAWLEDDAVYRYKADLLKQHNIAVWRNHDYIHSMRPDGVRKGVVDQLGWQEYGDPGQPVYNLTAPLALRELIGVLKERLNIPGVRYIGDLDRSCGKVLLMPGAAGGMAQINGIGLYKPDVLVCGEISEWETAEYVRDADASGQSLCLVLLGHIASEEPGSAFMETWLKGKFPGVKTTHVASGNSLAFL